jgi:hypothetical protein
MEVYRLNLSRVQVSFKKKIEQMKLESHLWFQLYRSGVTVYRLQLGEAVAWLHAAAR